MEAFTQKIKVIGVNPYVIPPEKILQEIFSAAGKFKGPIPVVLRIKRKKFLQHLVKYRGKWRLYLNGPMREHAGTQAGDEIKIAIEFDPVPRAFPLNRRFENELKKNKKAKSVFENCAPYLQKEIVRYINSLKSNVAIDKNIKKAIAFLEGKERFVGRNAIGHK